MMYNPSFWSYSKGLTLFIYLFLKMIEKYTSNKLLVIKLKIFVIFTKHTNYKLKLNKYTFILALISSY